MAINLENLGASVSTNAAGGVVVGVRFTGAADVDADGFTVNAGNWITSVTKTSEGVATVKFDRNFSDYVSVQANLSVGTPKQSYVASVDLTASGGTEVVINTATIGTTPALSDADAATISLTALFVA